MPPYLLICILKAIYRLTVASYSVISIYNNFKYYIIVKIIMLTLIIMFL